MPVPRCFSRARDIGAEKSSGSLPYCSWRLGTMDREQWIIRNGRPIVALCVKNSPALLPYSWCWMQPARDPKIRETAEYHLKTLKAGAKIGPR
jgi:hypothetical protein